MPDNIDQNLRRRADSLQLLHCFFDQRLSFRVQLLRLFDDRLRSNEKIDNFLECTGFSDFSFSYANSAARHHAYVINPGCAEPIVGIDE